MEQKVKEEVFLGIRCVNFADPRFTMKMNIILTCQLNTLPAIFVKGEVHSVHIDDHYIVRWLTEERTF